jgi:5'-deoxynucleotidase YfbR-like HD superfamily hydrolase
MAKPLDTSPPRAWQRMLSGRRLDLLDPSPLDVEIEDIAHGLSRVARWNGQTEGEQSYSVAEHSLLVESLVVQLKDTTPIKWRLAALLHDAPEYVIGDMISPFKAVIGDAYKAVEAKLQAAIHIRFGLPAELPLEIKALIKRADRISASIEATQIAGFSESEARRLFGRSKVGTGVTLAPSAPDEAKQRYLRRFAQLCG